MILIITVGLLFWVVFGKLFTAAINARLTSYLESFGILGDEQAGFRAGCSTLDHIFVLHSLIELYLAEKGYFVLLWTIRKRLI